MKYDVAVSMTVYSVSADSTEDAERIVGAWVDRVGASLPDCACPFCANIVALPCTLPEQEEQNEGGR